MQVTVNGVLVGAEGKSYDFKDRTTGEQRKGVAFSLYVTESFDKAPQRIRCSEADHAAASGWGFGQPVEASCEVTVNNNQVGLRAVSVTAADDYTLRAAS